MAEMSKSTSSSENNSSEKMELDAHSAVNASKKVLCADEDVVLQPMPLLALLMLMLVPVTVGGGAVGAGLHSVGDSSKVNV